MIYSCLSLALLCDLYFIPSLELIGSGIYKVICSIISIFYLLFFTFYLALSLPSDITGVIFTPFGTAGPELFSSLFGVFVSDTDIGTGL